MGGLESVLQAYRETKTLKKIVYTSSFFALGPTNGHEADEKQVPFSIFLFYLSIYEFLSFSSAKI